MPVLHGDECRQVLPQFDVVGRHLKKVFHRGLRRREVHPQVLECPLELLRGIPGDGARVVGASDSGQQQEASVSDDVREVPVVLELRERRYKNVIHGATAYHDGVRAGPLRPKVPRIGAPPQGYWMHVPYTSSVS